jgi:asparagine N-glycosylation enzyme membrane subunit Stt3
MATVIMGTLSVVAAYGAGRELFNRRIGIVAGLILATLPLHLFYSRIATGNLGDALFSTLMVYFAARAFRDNRRGDWVLLGVSLGMSQYFFEGGRFLFPVVFVSGQDQTAPQRVFAGGYLQYCDHNADVLLDVGNPVTFQRSL